MRCFSDGHISREWLKECIFYVNAFFEYYTWVELILGFVLPFSAIIFLVLILILLIRQSPSKSGEGQ